MINKIKEYSGITDSDAEVKESVTFSTSNQKNFSGYPKARI